jgi:hypothetical protein
LTDYLLPGGETYWFSYAAQENTFDGIANGGLATLNGTLSFQLTAVPECSSFALLATAAVLVLRRRR